MKRTIVVGLTTDQFRALRAATRLALADASLIRDRSRPTLMRAWNEIEEAWEEANLPPTPSKCKGTKP